MKLTEKGIIFGAIGALVLSFIYAPWIRTGARGMNLTSWDWIWSPPYGYALNVQLLGLTWLGILLIAGLLFYSVKSGRSSSK